METNTTAHKKTVWVSLQGVSNRDKVWKLRDSINPTFVKGYKETSGHSIVFETTNDLDDIKRSLSREYSIQGHADENTMHIYATPIRG